MVTELPNIESRCELLESCLPAAAKISIAYIADDVKSIEESAEEREKEAGIEVERQDWNPSGVIKNRALSLISVSKADGDHSRKGMFSSTKEEKQNQHLYLLQTRRISFWQHQALHLPGIIFCEPTPSPG